MLQVLYAHSGRIRTAGFYFSLFFASSSLDSKSILQLGGIDLHAQTKLFFSINHLFHFCPNQHKKKFDSSGQKGGDDGKTTKAVF